VRRVFHAVHSVGVASIGIPAVVAIFLGAPGPGAPDKFWEEFTLSCPASGADAVMLPVAWLLATPARQTFSSASDPRLCGEAHAVLLLRANAQLMLAFMLAIPAARAGLPVEEIYLMLAFWVASGFVCGVWLFLGGKTSLWLPDHRAPLMAGVQVFMACCSLGIYSHKFVGRLLFKKSVKFSRRFGASPEPVGPSWLQAGRDQSASAERRFTDSLQADYSRRQDDVRRARSADRTRLNEAKQVTRVPYFM